MSHKVIVIHGGSEFATYEDYLEYLKNYPLERILEKSAKRWKDNLALDLGAAHTVIAPEMPHPRNARYGEWVIWFEKFFALITEDDQVTLVGHSLGGAFLLRYLSAHTLPFPVAALHLVAAVVDNAGLAEDGGSLASFVVDLAVASAAQSLAQIPVSVHHAEDDEIVPYAHAERIVAALPCATLHTYQDRGHFLDTHFPELVAQIQRGV